MSYYLFMTSEEYQANTLINTYNHAYSGGMRVVIFRPKWKCFQENFFYAN